MGKNVFFALLKNEIAEQFRSKKIIVVIIVFLFFGLMSPVMAMFMPEIIASVSKSQNINIVVPPPTWLDSVAQYIKNLSQMSSFVLIIVYMGIVAKEKENGILVFLLVKPVKRYSYILSKYASVTIVAILGITISFIAAASYTYVFFDDFKIVNFIYLNLLMLLNIISTLFIVVLFSSLFKTQILAGIVSFAVYLIFNLAAQIKPMSDFLPSGLIIQGNKAIAETPISFTPVILTLVLCVLCILLSQIRFRNWEA